jgi:hypothetical protein
MYLDPTVRARFEAAVLLPEVILPTEDELGSSLVGSTGSSFVEMTLYAEKLFEDLCAGTAPELLTKEYEGQIDEVLDRIFRSDDIPILLALAQFDPDKYPDTIDPRASMVRFAYVAALASIDMGRARAQLSKISHPSVRAMAELYCLQFVKPDRETLAEQGLRILRGLGEDIPPLHRAELAAGAAEVCAAADDDVIALVEWGLTALEETDPLWALWEARGLMALSSIASAPQQLKLLSRAVDVLDYIGNGFLRNEVLTDLLGHAVAAADPRFVMLVIQRIIPTGWRTLVEALRRAMPQMVQTLGPQIVQALDAAMRRAQTVLGPKAAISNPPDHLDGVSAAHLHAEWSKIAIGNWAPPDPVYLSMYLDQSDLAPSMGRVSDSRWQGSPTDDEPFLRLRGRLFGLAQWLGEADQAVWNLFDIRFLFDNAADAAAYHQERLQHNSEGFPIINGAPSVGEDCAVFGGTRSSASGDSAINIMIVCYIFRIDAPL